ncbi:SDR family oxidoreductase [Nocardiopsis exhalans]|uniref:SDR family oxidoreductase n=1 Tax=Nocardiopsis exhalans TaxID=163604 RepID=A0ABY5D6R4_9ACTN|nr:SDR family oxidoreductase [Nocardiopsis exhalans]USY18778.1 SDR family oxidoreductase [Nocardiopsis exhalans]
METAVITGGAGGMGLATAKIMGRDHRIVLADVSQERVDAAVKELLALGLDASGVVCDITDRASVDRLFASARSHGRVRAVVHAAGVSPQMGSAELILRINAVGTINVTRAFLGTAGAGDALVNVASIAGHLQPAVLEPTRTYQLAFADVAKFEQRFVRLVNLLPKKVRPGCAYSMSKAFVIWYTRRIAAALGQRGARAVSVSPGSFDTAMGRLEERSGSGEMLEFAALKRFGAPEEVAEVLAFCAGDKPGYLTGTDILVDGGTKAGLNIKGMIAIARGL